MLVCDDVLSTATSAHSESECAKYNIAPLLALDDDPPIVVSERWLSEHNVLACAKTPGVALGEARDFGHKAYL